MVQAKLSLFFIATIATIAAHPLERREDVDIVGSAFSRRFYAENPIVIARDVDFDLEQREPSWDAVLHPIRTWREHRQVKAITEAAKAEAEAHIKQEHALADLARREPSWDAILHPMRTWREHRQVKAVTAAAKAGAEAHIKQEHAYPDLAGREPLWNAVFHPMRTWREHRQVKATTSAAKAEAEARIKQDHAALLGASTASPAFAQRSFDDFDLEARDFEEEY